MGLKPLKMLWAAGFSAIVYMDYYNVPGHLVFCKIEELICIDSVQAALVFHPMSQIVWLSSKVLHEFVANNLCTAALCGYPIEMLAPVKRQKSDSGSFPPYWLLLLISTGWKFWLVASRKIFYLQLDYKWYHGVIHVYPDLTHEISAEVGADLDDTFVREAPLETLGILHFQQNDYLSISTASQRLSKIVPSLRATFADRVRNIVHDIVWSPTAGTKAVKMIRAAAGVPFCSREGC